MKLYAKVSNSKRTIGLGDNASLTVVLLFGDKAKPSTAAYVQFYLDNDGKPVIEAIRHPDLNLKSTV